MRVIITGATGMVGEGVLLECLEHPAVEQVLLISRKPYGLAHPKVSECLVPNFMELEPFASKLTGYDACFFCAGVSSAGMNEADYTRITYDTTLSFAQTLAKVNPLMTFTYVSGASTDSSEKGRMMWARVKGRTENALTRLPFKGVYNFRPGLMKPSPGQKSIKTLYKIIGVLAPVVSAIAPKAVLSLHQVGRAMINAVLKGYPKQVLEIADIRALAEL